MGAWSADRVVADVERVAARGLPRDEFHREVAARIRRAFPVDAACWHGLDPGTLLLTTANPEELHAHGFLSAETEALAAQSVIRSEYERPDVNTFATLAGRRAPVGILSEATRGHPERSPRFVDFLSIRGTPYEMRGVFRTRGRAWGCVVLHRSEERGDFTRSEAEVLARLSRPIAEGLLLTLRTDAARRSDDDGAPGVMVLDRHDEPEMITAPAQVLLESMSAPRAARETVPFPVRTLAARTRHSGGGQTLHVATSAGWLSLHASLPAGLRSGRVAVVLQPARPERAAELSLETFGLTPREREIATLAVRGLSTKAISEQMYLSPWTVQDHLKAIFDKTGVRSRRALRSLVFAQDFMPAIAAGAPLDAEGRLVRS